MSTEPLPVGTPVWVELQSLDREAARAFYSALFGWTWELAGAEFMHYANASMDGQPVAGEAGALPGGPQITVWSIYLRTDDLDAATAFVEAHGGEVVVPTMVVGELGRMAVFRDPTGAFCGLWEPGLHRGFQVSGEEGYPCWFELNTRDAPGARDFYAGLGGGLETQKLEGMDYWTWQAEGRPRMGTLQMTEAWGELPPHWMVYFAVADTDAAAARVEELGGTLHHGPFDTPFGRIAVVADPQGAVFSIVEPAQGA